MINGYVVKNGIKTYIIFVRMVILDLKSIWEVSQSTLAYVIIKANIQIVRALMN